MSTASEVRPAPRPAAEQPVRVALSEARLYADRCATALLRAGFDLPHPPPPWLGA